MKKLCLALFLVVACKSSSSTTSQPSAQEPPPSTTEPAPAPEPTAPPPATPPEPTTPPTNPTTPAQTGVKPGAIGETCGDKDACATGLECVKYYGIAGARGPQFKSCEARCEGPKSKCPSGTRCVTVADGPGQVCRP